MPVQDGSVEVNYQRLGGKGLEAKVTLPAGMTGSLNWKGHRTRLHSGQQTVTIH
jgi:hypothetical protein